MLCVSLCCSRLVRVRVLSVRVLLNMKLCVSLIAACVSRAVLLVLMILNVMWRWTMNLRMCVVCETASVLRAILLIVTCIIVMLLVDVDSAVFSWLSLVCMLCVITSDGLVVLMRMWDSVGDSAVLWCSLKL